MSSVSTGAALPYQVLVVDDIGVNRTLVKSALSGSEFTVTEAADGVTALSLIAKQDFDAVILDIRMPSMDGITVCQRIRTNPYTKHLPVIVVTSLGQGEALERCFDSGADDFMSKPFDPDELIVRVKALAEHYRARRALAQSKETQDKIDLAWHEDYEIGVQFIDDDHKHLLNTLQDIRDAILKEDYTECAKLLYRMDDEAKSHFKLEEEFLAEAG